MNRRANSPRVTPTSRYTTRRRRRIETLHEIETALLRIGPIQSVRVTDIYRLIRGANGAETLRDEYIVRVVDYFLLRAASF